MRSPARIQATLMQVKGRYCLAGILCLFFFSSCSIIEKTARHGFENGYYRFRQNEGRSLPVYVNVARDTLFLYNRDSVGKDRPAFLQLPHTDCSGKEEGTFRFSKQSLDVDLTSVFFKYRRSVQHRPAQLTTDLNAAIYVGWRFDTYTIKYSRDVLQQCAPKQFHRGFDAGVFFGGGTASLSPFTTGGAIDYEYNGMILQYGAAAFLESSFASFGIAVGFDHLTGPHRNVWIYQRKPWFGFVVGIALQ